ncbi:ragulator complex protein LAMTOR1 [Accipiter gentilis]|uniref:ragulator complex protein LAMTOR1 n=1 Tax=Astur gentilis TaxID=8957 RepID=UPI0021107A15|nr:ragulator complex protein LAMTOR1 [Accipiter gentilis]
MAGHVADGGGSRDAAPPSPPSRDRGGGAPAGHRSGAAPGPALLRLAMGCCYSSEAEASDQEEETKRLLEPAASPPNKVLNGAEQSYHNLPSARTDEQAMLSSILAKTAINIIDVSAADSQGMEQHEYMDRARQYSTRLAMLSNNLTHWKKLPLLPSLTNQPHQVLASDPVPFADLQQVSRIAAYAFSALSQIRVDAKEELVVQFGIP